MNRGFAGEFHRAVASPAVRVRIMHAAVPPAHGASREPGNERLITEEIREVGPNGLGKPLAF
jgi:hypothetical protein